MAVPLVPLNLHNFSLSLFKMIPHFYSFTADKHSMPIRHSMGPLSPKKSLPIPMVTQSSDADYDVITEDAVSWTTSLSPDKSNSTLPLEGRRGKSSFTHRTPSPTFSKKSEKKGLLRNRSGSFDSHTITSTRKK